MKSHACLAILSALMFAACQSGQSLENDFVSVDIRPDDCFTEQSFGEAITLQAELFNDSIIHNPRSLSLIDNKLFSIDVSTQTDTLVRYYSLPDRRYAGYIFLRGQGPTEVLSPSSVQASADSASFWTYDTAKRTFIGCTLEALEQQSTSNIENHKHISLTDSVFRGIEDVFWIGNTHLLISDLYHYEERFFTIDTCTWSIKPVHNPTLHFKDTYTDNVKADIFSTRKCVTPDHNRLILAGRYLDLIEIYDRDGQLIRTMKGPEESFEFAFDEGRSRQNDVMIKSRKTRRAYLAVKATNDKVYALYSGKTKEDKEHYSYGRKLYVFSREGKPLERYLLDTPVIDFVVDEANGTIYAASENAEIVCFKL